MSNVVEKRERSEIGDSKEKREEKKRQRKEALSMGLKEGMSPEQIAEAWPQCCFLVVSTR